jgi:O-antigen/teichoic acid export membrane protein
MFGVELIFCAIVSSIAGVGAVAFLWFRPQFADMSLVPPFVSGVIFFLLQDWLRRYYFAIGKSGSSLWNDGVSYVGQVVLVGWLLFFHHLTLGSALWSIAITSGAAFGLGLAVERIRFKFAEVREAWRLSRISSRDLVLASQLQWFVYQGAMLVGASVLGAQAAGGVRATQNVVGPVNVAFQAMENIVPIRVGEEMRRGGIQQAAKYLWRFGIRGFLLLLVAFLVIAFFSKSFLSFVYGRQVARYAGILNLQLLYFLLVWPLRQFTYLFRTIGKTTVILGAALVAAMTSLVLVYPFVRSFDSLGIMLAAVAGQLANLLFMTVAWMHLKSTYGAEKHLQAMPK